MHRLSVPDEFDTGMPDSESEPLIRIPERPLDDLSDYVTSSMHADIAAVQAGHMSATNFAKQTDELVRAAAASDKALEGKSLSLALLDLSMLESVNRSFHPGATTEEAVPAPALQELLKKMANARGIIPQLSYEGLVYANPLESDPRTFLSGKLGQEEMLFYKLHASIEREFQAHLPHMLSVLQTHTDASAADNASRILSENAIPLVMNISAYMRMFPSNVSKEAFNAIRPFWSATKQYQGPSGKFSAGYFMLDTLVQGKNPQMAPLLQGKLHELRHYPNTSLAQDGFTGQDDMIQSYATISGGSDLLHLAQQLGDTDVSEKTSQLVQACEQNRKVHIGLAARFLPTEFKNGQSGTGGEPIKEYLQKFHDAYRNLPQA